MSKNRILPLMAACALVLSACGGDDDKEGQAYQTILPPEDGPVINAFFSDTEGWSASSAGGVSAGMSENGSQLVLTPVWTQEEATLTLSTNLSEARSLENTNLEYKLLIPQSYVDDTSLNFTMVFTDAAGLTARAAAGAVGTDAEAWVEVNGQITIDLGVTSGFDSMEAGFDQDNVVNVGLDFSINSAGFADLSGDIWLDDLAILLIEPLAPVNSHGGFEVFDVGATSAVGWNFAVNEESSAEASFVLVDDPVGPNIASHIPADILANPNFSEQLRSLQVTVTTVGENSSDIQASQWFRNGLIDSENDPPYNPLFAVPVAAETQYRYVAYVMGTVGAAVNFSIVNRDRTPVAYFLDGDDLPTLPNLDLVLDGTWQSVLVDFITPAGIQELLLPIEFSYAGNEGATIYVDDAWVYNMGPAGARVSDGGFESFETGEDFSLYQADGNGRGSRWGTGINNDTDATMTIVDAGTGEVHSGDRALAVTINTTTDGDAWDIEVSQNEIPVSVGQIYDYSVWVYAVGGSPTINFGLQTHGDSSPAWDGQGTIEAPTIPEGEWVEVSGATDAVSDVTIRAPWHLNYPENDGITIYFDDLVIEEQE